MMLRFYLKTKSFTNFSFILFLTGAVCYFLYCVTDRVIQKQTKFKSTHQVLFPQGAKEIIDHQKSQNLDRISKLFDRRRFTKNERAAPESIKLFQLKKRSSSAKPVSQGNTIVVEPTREILSLPSRQNANTQTFSPTKHLNNNPINTKNIKKEQESITTFPLEEGCSSKFVSQGNTISVTIEPTAKCLFVTSRQKASTPTFFPTRNIIQTLVNSKKPKTEQKSVKTLAPSSRNFEVIKNYSTMKLGGLVKPLVKKPSAVETAKQKEKVDLFIAVLTAPQRFDRRAVLRDTWISSIPNYSVAFKFFTDGKELSNKTKTMLSEEQDEFGDVEMLPTKGGYWFSHRFLHALFWAHHHYNFSYFLRLDDDYFVCLHHLYHDLQYRKKEKFLYWGWLWCQKKIVRMDEGFVLLGADLAQEIIRRNKSLYCHPFGDQMIEMWFSRLIKEGIKVKYFADNARILHFGLGQNQLSQNMCQDLLGIHQTYPDQMRLYWNRTKDVWYSSPKSFKKIAIKKYKNYCHVRRGLDWTAFYGIYRNEPKPCWKPGVAWPRLHSYKIHVGREKPLKKPLKKLKPTTKEYTTSSPVRIRI